MSDPMQSSGRAVAGTAGLSPVGQAWHRSAAAAPGQVLAARRRTRRLGLLGILAPILVLLGVGGCEQRMPPDPGTAHPAAGGAAGGRPAPAAQPSAPAPAGAPGPAAHLPRDVAGSRLNGYRRGFVPAPLRGPQGLERHRATDAVARALDRLTWGNAAVLDHAKAFLASQGPAAVPALIAFGQRSLGSQPQVADSICEVLAAIADPRSLPFLLRAAASPQDFVRMKAVRALAVIGSEDAAPGLISLVGDANPAVRTRAIRALANTGGVAARSEIGKILRGNDAPAVLAALQGLADHADPRLVEFVAPLLDVDSRSFQRAAAIVLARAGDPRGCGRFLSWCESGSLEDVEHGARGLVEGGCDVDEGLLRALARHPIASVRGQAAPLAARASDPLRREILEALSRDADEGIRKVAARLRLEQGDTRAAEPYAAKLASEDLIEVREGLRALQEGLVAPGAAAMVLRRYRDGDTQLRRWILQAAPALGGEGARPILELALRDVHDVSAATLGGFALVQLGLIGAAGLPLALEVFRREEAGAGVRLAALHALWAIGGVQAGDALVRIARDGSQPQGIRLAALEALGTIADFDAVEPLRALAAGDPSVDIRWAAVEVLWKYR